METNMKPLTALFKPLEKLITEHGSAVILREHLALFKTQLTISEKKIQILETDKQQLTAEITNLSAVVQNCQNENRKLLKTISQLQKKTSHKTPPKRSSSSWVRNW
jgi:chromosome segregation ATPase